MQPIKHIKGLSIVSDTSKGQKIIAALYLVTNHLSDNDPLKTAIRTKSVALVGDRVLHDPTVGSEIGTLLGAAVLAGLISEKNASIIMLEIEHFLVRVSEDDTDTIAHLFSPSSSGMFNQTVKKTKGLVPSMTHRPIQHQMSNTTPTKHADVVDAKNKRQETILSFINERKSAAIKDIALLFPAVSEKTIQRELGVLVESGRITKRGSKRWSIYMAVSQ